jgi:hypothetical protein
MTQKKRNKHFWKEKQLIRLRIKDGEINKAIRNQGWVELEEPIPNGYYAEWVLREDILRRSDAEAYQEALDACKEKIWSRNPEFRYKDKKTKRWVQVNPKLKDIKKEAYENLSPTAKKFFVENTGKERRYWRQGFSDKWYSCTLSYELVVKVTKAFITHRREHDGILYQMDAENERMMYQIAGNDNPWGGRNYRTDKFYNRMQNRKEKFAANRELREEFKGYGK